MTLAVSVVLCTRNRAGLVGRLVGQLREQAAQAGRGWELVVVDNGSTDVTPRVLEAASGTLPMRVLRLDAPGQTRARNAGIRASRGDLLVFVDDDVRLCEAWLATWCGLASSGDAHGWFGGRVLTDWGGRQPSWIRDPDMDLIDGALVRHNQGDASKTYAAGDALPVGANCAARRSVFEQVGLFREDLGHRGELRAIGDETEWFARARAQGMLGAYVPEALAWHPALPERLSLRGLWEHGRATARGIVARDGVTHLRQARRPVSWIWRGVGQWLRGRGDRFRQCVIHAGMASVVWEARHGRAHGRSAAEPPRRDGT